MALALALLKLGSRDVVLKYFELCARFWVHGKNKLDEWSAIVRRGGIPEFRGNLRY
jgi:hypothetical protein